MSNFTNQGLQLAGSMLVVLQFGILAVLAALAAPNLTQGAIVWSSGLVLLASGVLGLWTLTCNRLGNFNIHPAPKANGALVTGGPYRWIRHPMYTSVLMGAAALAMVSGLWMGWGAWLILLLVLLAKSMFEENWLCEHHPQYDAYRRVSKRFIPWVL